MPFGDYGGKVQAIRQRDGPPTVSTGISSTMTFTVGSSSVKKGESVRDTLQTIEADAYPGEGFQGPRPAAAVDPRRHDPDRAARRDVGLFLPPDHGSLLNFEFGGQRGNFYLLFTASLVCLIANLVILNTSLGYYLRAMRDNENAAQAIGAKRMQGVAANLTGAFLCAQRAIRCSRGRRFERAQARGADRDHPVAGVVDAPAFDRMAGRIEHDELEPRRGEHLYRHHRQPLRQVIVHLTG